MKRFCVRTIALVLVFVMAFQLVSCSIMQEMEESVCETEVQFSVSGPRISISTLEPSSDGHEYTTKTESYQLDQSVGVHTPIDYENLYVIADNINLLQDWNAYEIQKITVLYIDPELVEEYLMSEDSIESFFGFSTGDLQEEYGNVALTFSSDGTVSKGITIVPVEESSSANSYDYKSFLSKLAVGCGIIIIGATLSVTTGGMFACAMVAISKAALSSAVIAGAATSTYYTAKGVSQGKSVIEAFEDSCEAGLDSFADGFVIGAVIGSVYSVTHSVCFVAGTPVATPAGSVPIESLTVGDIVFTQNLETGKVDHQPVLDTFVSETHELVSLKFSNHESLLTTPSHPFYSPTKGWTAAAQLRAGEILLALNGECVIVEQVQHELFESPVTVFNIESASNHNYFVGKSDTAVLVHNKCSVGQYDSYGELGKLAEKGDGIAGHHIPSKEFMKQYGVSERDAMAINIKHSTHVKTFTYGYSSSRQQYYMSLSPNEALRVDMSNMRAIFRQEGTLDEMAPVLNEYAKALKIRFPELFG